MIIQTLNFTSYWKIKFPRYKKENFTTRIAVNDKNIDRISVTKLLGIWISDDKSWSRNCKKICMKAFSRLSMITNLKYGGVGKEDLLDIY